MSVGLRVPAHNNGKLLGHLTPEYSSHLGMYQNHSNPINERPFNGYFGAQPGRQGFDPNLFLLLWGLEPKDWGYRLATSSCCNLLPSAGQPSRSRFLARLSKRGLSLPWGNLHAARDCPRDCSRDQVQYEPRSKCPVQTIAQCAEGAAVSQNDCPKEWVAKCQCVGLLPSCLNSCRPQPWAHERASTPASCWPSVTKWD